ncbi:MAG: TraR/DksA family transcriptional regulator [Phycisphaerae bacterium]
MDETEIRTLLEERLHELSERLEEIDEDLHEHEEDDFGDRAIETAGDEVLEGLGSAGQREIQQIRAALVRLDKGTYGTCTRCGQPVGERRLQAIPHAALCITCAGQG